MTTDREALAAQIKLERPPRADLGDYSTNAPLLLAPRLQSAPREVAERLAGELADRLGDALARADVAGPGFLNLYLSDVWFVDALAHDPRGGRALRLGDGRSRDSPINVEFVSANPTGPLHIGHARSAAYGDALARMLELRGYERDARVLHQRLRQPDRQARGVGARACARRAGARRRLPRRLRGRARAGRARSYARPRRAGARGARRLPRADPWLARALRRALRRLVLRALAARERRGRRACSSCWRARRDLQPGWRAVAAHDRARRRQGPRARPLERRAHLLHAPTSPTSRTSARAASSG